MLIAGLIAHPEIGLILFEAGCAEDIETDWDSQAVDLFPRTKYEPYHHLPTSIEATGQHLNEVTAIIIGHLHLDHAGGLDHFRNTGVPIYVHEEEYKYACWAAATKREGGLYLSDYLFMDGTFNWITFSEAQLDLCTGITLYHCPGHTPGLCILQVNLERDGTYIWTTDQYHIRENFEQSQVHGWLLRDYQGWVNSHEFLKRLQKTFSAILIFGHDFTVADGLINAKPFYV